MTAAAVFCLVGAPLLMLLFSSVRSTRDRLPFEATSFTLDNYVRVFTDANTYRLLANTLIYAVGSVALSLILAMSFAYLIERTDIPWRTSALVLVLAPMALPPFVAGIAWVLLANPQTGLLNVLLRGAIGASGDGPLDVYSMAGMTLVTGIMLVPSVYIMVSGTLSRMDPAFEEASRLSGVSPWQTILRITVPLLKPGILGAVIYYFVVAVEIFEIPALLGIPSGNYLLSTRIYYLVNAPGHIPDYGLASCFGVVSLLLASGLIYLYSRTTRQRDRFVTVSGRGYRPQLIGLGNWRYVSLGALVVYFLVAVVLPFVVLVWKSVLPPYGDISLQALRSANLDMYAKVLHSADMLAAARHTVLIAGITAVGAMSLSTLVAWLSVRSRFRGGSLPDRLTFISSGVPSIVVALAVMFVYISIPLPIYSTIWIIIIALATRYIAYGARVMSAAYLQVHRELEEASWASGVSWPWTMIRITLPLVWPSFLRGCLWMVVQAVRDATIALILVSAANETVAARLWMIWFEEADLSMASAISVMLMLVSACFTYLVARQTLSLREGARL